MFKKCSGCNYVWENQKDFILDNNLKLNGYKADFEELDYGLFFFTHDIDSCLSTIALEVVDFKNLYNGKIFTERLTGSDDCPRYCKNQEQLLRCNAFCECAYVREIINIIKTIKMDS